MGISIQGNLAPELSDVSFHDIADDKHIYLANGDVIVPVDFEWNLIAPTHVVAKTVTDLPDSLEYETGVTDRVDLIVEGLLNTETDSTGTEWVFFEPETKHAGSADDWGGVFVDWARSGHVIRHGDFGYAANPLYLNWPGADSVTTISNCSIHHFADVGLWVRGALLEGSLIDSVTVARGGGIADSLAWLGVFLDGVEEAEVSNNLVQMTGTNPKGSMRGIETYFGKNVCDDSASVSRSLEITGNEIVGPGDLAENDAVVGFYSNYVCGGLGRVVTIMDNQIHDCDRVGAEFAQSAEVQVSCNQVWDNARAVELWRDSEPSGIGVRFRTNYLEVPSGHGSLLRTTNVLKTLMGGLGTKGNNYLKTSGSVSSADLTHLIFEDELGHENQLNATKNYWARNDTLLTSTAVVLDTTLVWTTLPDTDTPGSDDWPNVNVNMLYQSEPSDTCLALPGAEGARPVRSHNSALAAEASTTTDVMSLNELPAMTRIGVPSPNPSHGPFRVQLEISPSHEGVYRVDVFDVAGRRVAVLVDGAVRAGRHTVEWRGRSESGRASAPGVYFLRVTGPGVHKTSKLVVTR